MPELDKSVAHFAIGAPQIPHKTIRSWWASGFEMIPVGLVEAVAAYVAEPCIRCDMVDYLVFHRKTVTQALFRRSYKTRPMAPRTPIHKRRVKTSYFQHYWGF